MNALHPGFAPSVDQQRRTDGRTWVLMYLGVLAVSAVLGVLTLGTAPAPFALPFTMLFLASILVILKPVSAVYLTAFFTLCTDSSISAWFPFTKNLSSSESILYMGDSLSLNPLELILAVAMISLLLRILIDRTSPRFVQGGLFRPLMVFTGFLLIGFVFGQATGGDRYAAMWEFRPFLCLPILYVLVTNLFTTRRQYERLVVVMLAALLVHATLALRLLFRLSAAQRESLESLVDHGSAVQFNVVLLLALTVALLPKTPRWLRWLMPLAAIPIGWVWLVSERRAAAIGLAVSVLVSGVLLSKLNPRRLRIVGPIFAVIALGYLGAFWHSESAVGFPAQAIKSVVAPGQVSEKDQSSDLYRILENIDISATIHAKPLLGMGFGQKFLRPAPLPDISNFPFYEYIPHNSLLWIWIKTGVGGFIAMLYFLGSAIRQGTRAIVRLAHGREVAMVFAACSYVVMYAVFAYVDIAWDTRSMVTLAIAAAICSEYVKLPRRAGDVEVPADGRDLPVPVAAGTVGDLVGAGRP